MMEIIGYGILLAIGWYIAPFVIGFTVLGIAFLISLFMSKK
jgi:hypothetical protein